MMFTVRPAEASDTALLSTLALELWPENNEAELSEEITQLLTAKGCFFALAYADGEAAGFAQCQLRQDYVEGCEHSPAGYLEGIYVRPAFRRKGAAAQLLAACRAWAKAQGCHEFASDCELENSESAAFHAAMGFCEASRNIHFVQSL